MEMDRLNKEVLERVRNRIVISNLESEENMKLNKKRQIMPLIVLFTITITGSLITANAATNGELAEKVKNTIKVIFIDDNGKEEEVKGTTYTDSNNHVIEKYKFEKDGAEGEIKVDKSNLNGQNLSINATLKGDESSIVIESKK